MKVMLNGAQRELRDGATVDDAVDAAGGPDPHAGVAVAVDGEVVPRSRWPEHQLADGQQVEVLRAVQGG